MSWLNPVANKALFGGNSVYDDAVSLGKRLEEKGLPHKAAELHRDVLAARDNVNREFNLVATGELAIYYGTGWISNSREMRMRRIYDAQIKPKYESLLR